MKIAIMGTRGIPNNYGGFEQVTEHLSVGLAAKGYEVSVYNSHNHPYQKKRWNGVEIIHCYDPEYLFKTAGQFIYDLNCLRNAAKKNFDVILIMGYSSSSIWKNFFPKQTAIVYNMDGLEWKRTKYIKPVRLFLKYAEKMAAKHAGFHIADSVEIQKHLKNTYNLSCSYIPYGADLSRTEIADVLTEYKLIKKEYFLLIARLEKENNIDMILQGFIQSGSEKKFIVIGNTENKYGKYILKKYHNHKKIQFAGAVFDQDRLHTLRLHASVYFHGHSVGGTNPSLLEAMASKALIAAHHNIFTKAILNDDAFFFKDAADVAKLINSGCTTTDTDKWIENNLYKIKMQFNWPKIIEQYDEFLCFCSEKIRNEKIAFHTRYAYK